MLFRSKKPVCEHRSLSTLPLPGACAARHRQGPVNQGQLPRENARRTSRWCYVTPVQRHAGATSRRRNVTLASAAAGSPRLLSLSPPNRVSQSPRSSCCFNPILSGREQMPSGDLHAKAGPNPKLNPRSCANKEEKGKFLPAASGTAD